MAQPLLSKATLTIENTEKRDTLRAIERKYQKIWADSNVFHSDAPTVADAPPKFFGTIAYPYMNGSLHVGHGFTISKVEFATGHARMKGKRALFPLGFHCTGMAIKACADKLAREIELFGPTFEGCPDDADDADYEEGQATAATPVSVPASGDVTKFKSNKTKASAKSIKAKYQFQIMLAQGIPREEIQLFADPYHWVHVFPEAGIRDISDLGLRIDWRRSFVTTDANPYYDSFVRWQMNRLKELGKIKFGTRHTVYSPKDRQPCLDHDRSEGEGVGVQVYTAIKMRVLQWSDAAESAVHAALPPNSTVYFVPATLRPETMYGQTCCFVSPGITYGLYATSANELLFLTDRAARNMAFQGIFGSWGHYSKALELRGSDVVGTVVDAPLSIHSDGVRVLPMETVKDAKGTGVVTSVPSESPDDYATVSDLANKSSYYGIQKEWAQLENIPIIETPAYGTLTGRALVEKMKIVSPKDPRLVQAKELAYKEGYYNGKMIYGEFSGIPVQQAKDLVKRKLIDAKLAFEYAEPDGHVVSRSNDVCVVALLDQWYLNYGSAENGGDDAWCAQVLQHLNSGDLNTFSAEAKHQFTKTLGWLSQWACARSYGLGSKLPWDQSVLVESLSDSTIYPAYYTIAHYLHRDIYGNERGIGNINAQQMSDDVWDFVFARKESVETDIPLETLIAMRREFEYWYPLDVRVSGKDLIQNHLTFFLYIHVALWPKEYWPRGIRPNGHLLLNGDKMSKSTGNFLTLKETVEKFGADAARITLADAGDAIEDANFEESVANKTILKLYELKKWLEEMIRHAVFVDSADDYVSKRNGNEVVSIDNVQRTGALNLWDKLFEKELNKLAHETDAQYSSYLFKNALKLSFYDLTAARDFYREVTKSAGAGMHRDLVQRYAEFQALLLAPVASHWCEYIWIEVLGKSGSIHNATFPQPAPEDKKLTDTLAYIRKTTSAVTSAQSAQQKKIAKGKAVTFDPKMPHKLVVFYATTLPDWQIDCINQVFKALEKLGFVDVKTISKGMDKSAMKRAMPFIQGLKKSLDSGQSKADVLSTELGFDEQAILEAMVPGLIHTLPKCKAVELVKVVGHTAQGGVSAQSDRPVEELPGIASGATPGEPRFLFENVDN